jgi:hypothetical protein
MVQQTMATSVMMWQKRGENKTYKEQDEEEKVVATIENKK